MLQYVTPLELNSYLPCEAMAHIASIIVASGYAWKRVAAHSSCYGPQTPELRQPGGDLLGGVSALQETDLTGPLSIFKLLP
jgi:hypothetical protein